MIEIFLFEEPVYEVLSVVDVWEKIIYVFTIVQKTFGERIAKFVIDKKQIEKNIVPDYFRLFIDNELDDMRKAYFVVEYLLRAVLRNAS